MSGRTARSRVLAIHLTLFFQVLGVTALVAAGCNTDRAALGRPSEGCSLNSDCNSPLVCAFGRCHQQCVSGRDCSAPGRCVAADKPYRVCELAGERRTCAVSTECPSPHVCAVDGQCRAECRDARDCTSEQVCSFGTCADPNELQNGQLTVSLKQAAEGRLCNLHSECAPGLRCIANRCYVECREPIDCSDGASCEGGLCVRSQPPGDGGNASCERHSDCAGDLVCVSGRCRSECAQNKDCLSGQACVDSRCVPAGGGTNDAATPDATIPDATLADGAVLDGSPDVTEAGPPSCSDGTKNGVETDVDCGGGVCPPCAVGASCSAQSDCASLVCTTNVCVAATCTDGVKNGTESDIDCGAGCSVRCGAGQVCKTFDDCDSQLCAAGRCRSAACHDGAKNGAETDVDCGGPSCPPCSVSAVCLVSSDCTTRVCTSLRCVNPTCSDGVKNGLETDVDCGGRDCTTCADQKSCTLPVDCVSQSCVAARCQPPSCTDGVQNLAETDRDCGGGACPPCSSGARCNANADCQSGLCQGGSCIATHCNDGAKNGFETDIDCGGSQCGDCASGKSCQSDDDCISRRCYNAVCEPMYTLTIAKQGTGSGRVHALPEIDCGDLCAFTYLTGTQVTLTAEATLNSTFSGFSGGGCSGTGPCTVTLSQAHTVTATFDSNYQDYTVIGSKYWSPHNLVAVAFDQAGEVVLAGQATSAAPIDFGSGPLYVAGQKTFTARVALTSAPPLWGKLWSAPGSADHGPYDVAVGSDGRFWVLGFTNTNGNLGSGALQAGFFLAGYDPSTGDPLVTRTFQSPALGYAVGHSPSARILGAFRSPSNDVLVHTRWMNHCGECSDTPTNNIVRLRGSDATPAWSQNDFCAQDGMIGPAITSLNHLVFGANGVRCNFGAAATSFPNQAVVWSWTDAGVPRWSRALGGVNGVTTVTGVTTDSRGDVYVIGAFSGQLPLQGGRVLIATGGPNDSYLIKLSGSDGSILWGRRFGTAVDNDTLAQIWELPGDEVLVYGTYPHGSGNSPRAYNFDGVTLPGRPLGAQWFLARFNASGRLLSVRQPAPTNIGTPAIRTFVANEKILFTGRTSTLADFGGGVTVPANTNYAVFYHVN